MHAYARPFLALTVAPALFALTASLAPSLAATPSVELGVLADMPYKSGAALTEYERQRCQLDLYLPKNAANFATLVWFHGGGLVNGDKGGTKTDPTPAIARSLAAAGIAVVVPNYRLSPQTVFPSYIQDAAAAVAWTHGQIPRHGGDAKLIFVGGHSAGGYLALMLGMDERFLSEAGLKIADIAGFVPMSGQVLTHYTVLRERGLGQFSVMADAAAPVHFARAKTPPFLVLYGDRDMAARAEENIYFVALMKAAGNTRIAGQLMTNRTHGSIAHEMVNANDPTRLAILEFMRVNARPH